jgi:succinyl-diaminopimelate desuccinylase
MENRHIKKNKKKENFKQDNFLLYVPKKKHGTWEIRKDKVYLIFHHKKAIERFVRWLVKKPNVSDMVLDDRGSAVWLLIDGKATVYDIGKKLDEKFGSSCQPVYERLIMYIRYLNRRGWITFDRGDQKGGKVMEINMKIDAMKEKLISATQEVLKIKSVQDDPKPGMPFGEGVSKALDAALEISKKLGFKTVNVDGYVGYAEYGQGEDYVGILGHLDVVPEGNGWKYPPYGAEIHDEKIYARGSMDDKGPIMASLFGLKAIMDLKIPLTKKVRIIFGTNEETGSTEIPYYLKKEKPPVSGFTPDAEYPIIYGEKGITIFDIVKELNVKSSGSIIIKYIKGGQRPNMVPDYTEAGILADDKGGLIRLVQEYSKKTGFDIKAVDEEGMIILKSVGIAAHGSLPQLGKNAIMQLFDFLGSLQLGKSDIAQFIQFINKNAGFDVYGDAFGVGLEDKESGKLSFNIGVIDMDQDKVTMAFNLRYPVTFKLDDMMKPFNERIKGTGIKIENFEHQKPLFFPADHPLIQTLKKVYTEQTGKEATLLAIGGGTYAKEMPNIVAFGPLFPGQIDLDHQANEYIEIDSLIKNTKIYAHAIYELAK